jgi:hypothetical protein
LKPKLAPSCVLPPPLAIDCWAADAAVVAANSIAAATIPLAKSLLIRTSFSRTRRIRVQLQRTAVPAVPVQKPPDRVTPRRCELLDQVARHADTKE